MRVDKNSVFARGYCRLTKICQKPSIFLSKRHKDHRYPRMCMADEEGAGGKKSRPHITHAQNDARYVEQGMLLFLAPDPDSAKDLARMNKKKNGRPFEYSELTIMAIAGVRYNLQLAYRSCEGLAISALGKKDAPDYTTLCRRINKMNVTSAEGCVEVRSKGSLMRLIPDGTGLTPSTRSDWIRHKHKVKRGWIRLSVMIEHDTQKIVAFKVTDERTGDSPQFEGLLEDSLECLGIDARQAPRERPGRKGQMTRRTRHSPGPC